MIVREMYGTLDYQGRTAAEREAEKRRARRTALLAPPDPKPKGDKR